MSLSDIDELSEVIDRVKNWSIEGRVALMRRVLATSGPGSSSPPTFPRGRSASEIIETFRVDAPLARRRGGLAIDR